MALKGLVSYWFLPVFSGFVWLGTLLGMLLYWTVHQDARHLSSMPPGQHIAYMSDIGALDLKPLFIAGNSVTVVFLDLSFLAERWLRHKGRLVPNQSRGEKLLVLFSIFFAAIGTAGLVLLAVFDTVNYSTVHNICLLLFIAGYLFSAVCLCWEYQRLGIKRRDQRVLRISFWVKLTFILVELCLAIAFAALSYAGRKNIAAVLEWTVSFIFTAYIWSFVIDLWPAVRTKAPHRRFAKPSEVLHAMEEGSEESVHASNRRVELTQPHRDF